MNFKLANPTRLYFGENAIQNVTHELKGVKNVLLTYGSGSIKRSGLYEEVNGLLEGEGIQVFELSNIPPNPTLDKVNEGSQICKENNIDYILAVGGGSVIDCSKAIAVAAKYQGDIWDVIKFKKPAYEKIKLGTILTLAATSTENNYYSVITNTKTKEKLGWALWPLNFPEFSILDKKYTLSVPKNQTVYGIVDILSHMMENYFNDKDEKNSIIRVHNKELEILMSEMINVGVELVNDLHNNELREAMLYIGSQGLSTKVRHVVGGNWSCHLMEHALSAVYDIPHGGGLSIVFPNWMDYVVENNVSKFVSFAENVMHVERESESDLEYAKKGINLFKGFLRKLGAPLRMSDYDIKVEDINILVEKSMNGMEKIGGFNPLDKHDVKNILEKCL